MKATLSLTALLLVLATGCGDSDDDKAATAEPVDTVSYVDQVNELCEALIDEVVPVTGDAAPTPTRDRYLANKAKLDPIYKKFDDAVRAVEVKTEDDKEADAAFEAMLAAFTTMDQDFVAKAATMGDAEWTTYFESTMDAFMASPERSKVVVAGIQCPAR